MMQTACRQLERRRATGIGILTSAALLVATIICEAPAFATDDNQCDVLAASPTDPARIGPGVPFDRIEPAPAVAACISAAAEFPSIDRFKFQLARALNKAKRFEEAAELYRQLAERNYAPAAYNLAILLIDGIGVERDPPKAIELLTKAADQGFALAQNQMGVFAANGRYVPRDPVAGRGWYERAAQQGEASAENELGWMLKNGVGGDRDIPRAIQLFERSAGQGNHLAEFNLGKAFQDGNGVDKDPLRAAEWLSRSALGGYAPAMNDLAVMYQNATGVERDLPKAFHFFEQAARQGMVIAQVNLGKAYANGWGVQIDLSKAAEWYRAAAENGDAWAQNELGVYLQNGKGVPRDEAAAAGLYKRSGDQGFNVAQANLAFMYANGIGIGKDLGEAVRWYTAASDQGNAWAQEKLATLYRDGNGVTKDEAKAAELFRKSAEKGFPYAQTSLAFMYANGQGVERNYQEAQRWYLAAAKQNNGLALASLGWLNHVISDLPRDDIKAYIWYQLATQAGYTDSFLSLGELLSESLESPASKRFGDAESEARRFVYADSRKLLLSYLAVRDPELKHRLLEARLASTRQGGNETSANNIDRLAKDYALAATIRSDPIFAEHPELATRALQMNKVSAFAEASHALQKSVDLGSTRAMLLLGNLNLRNDRTASGDYYYNSLYRDGNSENAARGSASRAAELYETAKDGSFAARTNLAVLYELGHGVPQNKEKASQLYKEAMAWTYNGPAQLGLLRLSLDELWSADPSNGADQLSSAQTPISDKNDISIETLGDFATITITDKMGRRMFSGGLRKGQTYRPPRDRNDLIFWPGYYAKDFVIRLSAKTIKLDEENIAGVRLDRERLTKQRDYLILDREGKPRHAEFLPDETLTKSRITLAAATDSNIYVHDNQNIFGIERELSKDDRIRLPDLPLTLVVRPREPYKKEPTASSVSIMVDRKKVLTITGPPGCLITIRLNPEGLRRLGLTHAVPVDCGALKEDSEIPYVVDAQNRPIAYASKPPDEQVQGVIAGFLRINRGLARLRLQMGGRADELYRADKIFLAQDLREHGPNSFDTVQDELYLAESEIGLGLIDTARSRLDGLLTRLTGLSDVPADLEAAVLEAYGSVLLGSGRYLEAERMLIRALAVRHKSNASGKAAPEFAIGGILAQLSVVAERLGETQRALMYQLRNHLLVQADAPERGETFNTEVAPQTLVRIIELLQRLDRRAEAQNLMTFAHREAKRDIVRDVPEPLKFPLNLSVYERTFGPVDRSELIAKTLGYLGQVYAWMGRHQEALPLFEQLQKTSNNIFGDGHPKTALARAKVAEEYRALGNDNPALSTARAGFDGLTNFITLRSSSRQSSRAGADALRPVAFTLLDSLYPHAGQNSDEAFQVAQRLRSSSAAAALQALAFRLGEQQPQKRDTVRRIQDLGDELIRLDTELMTSLASAPRSSTDRIRERISRTETTLRALQSGRNSEDDFSGREGVISYRQLAELLDPNEALIFIEPGNAVTHVFAATRRDFKWFKAEISIERLAQDVTKLRCGLDAQQWRGEGREICHTALGVYLDGKTTLPFDLATARRIYSLLIEPAEDIIAGKNLIFCLSGPLTSIPAQVLVMRKPAVDLAISPSQLDGVEWLALHHAVSVVPSVASFVAMRSSDSKGGVAISAKRKDFIGLGNPALAGNPQCRRTTIPRDCSEVEEAARQTQLASREGADMTRSYFRGNVADVDAVRKICPLPETEVELRCVARSIGRQEKLILGPELTETAIKQLPLDSYRIIHFATHGLLADEARSFGSPEPALVLTPPREPTVKDDGLLTASEISGLKLNADWVILSACNTAAAGSFDTDALSGLARAFFYAGAKTLLVSHWAVDSTATVVFISRAFGIMGQHHDVAPVEALRQSTLAMIRDPLLAHPAKWAPFVLIGDTKRINRH